MKAIDLAEIFKAVVAKFNASTSLKNSVSGLYAYQAPNNAAFPYIILTVQGNQPWDTFGSGPAGEGLILQFSVFSKKFPDLGECMNIVKLLTEAYDEAELAITGYAHLRLERMGGIFPIGHPTEGVFHAPIRYRLTVQKL